jgi:hypothetical protein
VFPCLVCTSARVHFPFPATPILALALFCLRKSQRCQLHGGVSHEGCRLILPYVTAALLAHMIKYIGSCQLVEGAMRDVFDDSLGV